MTIDVARMSNSNDQTKYEHIPIKLSLISMRAMRVIVPISATSATRVQQTSMLSDTAVHVYMLSHSMHACSLTHRNLSVDMEVTTAGRQHMAGVWPGTMHGWSQCECGCK